MYSYITNTKNVIVYYNDKMVVNDKILGQKYLFKIFHMDFIRK